MLLLLELFWDALDRLKYAFLQPFSSYKSSDTDMISPVWRTWLECVFSCLLVLVPGLLVQSYPLREVSWLKLSCNLQYIPSLVSIIFLESACFSPIASIALTFLHAPKIHSVFEFLRLCLQWVWQAELQLKKTWLKSLLPTVVFSRHFWCIGFSGKSPVSFFCSQF